MIERKWPFCTSRSTPRKAGTSTFPTRYVLHKSRMCTISPLLTPLLIRDRLDRVMRRGSQPQKKLLAHNHAQDEPLRRALALQNPDLARALKYRHAHREAYRRETNHHA